MNNETHKIAVVIPCYKISRTLKSVIDDIGTEVTSIYCVDDGCPDESWKVANSIAQKDSRVHVIRRKRNGGVGAALITGYKAALEDDAEIIVKIDGDGQMPAEDIGRVYKHLTANDLDFAKTFRVQRDDGPYRVFLSKVFNLVFQCLFPGLPCRDINSKPKIFKREVFDQLDLEDDGWFIDAEIMIKVRRMGLKVDEIPTSFKNLDSRASFVRWSAILEIVMRLLLYRIKEFWVSKKK